MNSLERMQKAWAEIKPSNDYEEIQKILDNYPVLERKPKPLDFWREMDRLEEFNGVCKNSHTLS